MIDRELSYWLAEIQRHLDEAGAFNRNSDEARRRHFEAIGSAKFCVEKARAALGRRKAA